MRFKSERMRLSGLSAAGGMERNASPLARILSYLVTAVALVLALAFSACHFRSAAVRRHTGRRLVLVEDPRPATPDAGSRRSDGRNRYRAC